MFRCIVAPALCVLLTVSSVTAQPLTEAEAWDVAKDSGTSAEIFAFIEAYPDGTFAQDAKALMIDLLWVELGSDTPTTTSETTEAETIPVVTFSTPLTEGAEGVVGRTLEELIDDSPLYPPVEGLPAEYWETQQCSACHEWEQANLCTQANTYLSIAGAENLLKEHPYGGTFKLNLRYWAQTGCE